jgi:hypothetical protein
MAGVAVGTTVAWLRAASFQATPGHEFLESGTPGHEFLESGAVP